MLAAAIIVFREFFEAGLIIGIVLAVTRGIPGNRLWVAMGAAAGLAGSCVLAVFMGAIAGAFDGSGQEVFNAAVMATAVLMLGWHNVWMARHGRQIAAEMKATGQAVASGAKPLLALSTVVGLAVLREGAEVVLFLYGIAAGDGGSRLATLVGGVAIGVSLGASVTALAYLGLVTIPARRLFAVTTAMITVLAAGMAAQSAGFLEQAGVVTVLGETAWNTASILSESSILGRVLHTLAGYSDQPSVLQVTVYAVVLVVILGLTRAFAPPPRPASVGAAAAAASRTPA